MKWRDKCLSVTSIQKCTSLKTTDYFGRIFSPTRFKHHPEFVFFLRLYVVVVVFFAAVKLIKMDISNKLSSPELERFFTE